MIFTIRGAVTLGATAAATAVADQTPLDSAQLEVLSQINQEMRSR
ncbi:hypothetical protein [Kushneria aurantia]|uniref:Uncharacterized protein n=1 Tax=Kushneria aurantia TaxID=504092 RepID=A0ABV6G3Q6_9GAMM|nr:hypothetical protein [Kushneria aurantia]